MRRERAMEEKCEQQKQLVEGEEAVTKQQMHTGSLLCGNSSNISGGRTCSSRDEATAAQVAVLVAAQKKHCRVKRRTKKSRLQAAERMRR